MYALHINCGGSTTTIGNRTYEADQYLAGSAKFVPFAGNWGTSSTGQFWDRDETSDDYTAKNVSVLRMNDSELYTTARLSPLSLTYYARCLANGNYTVTLHFAEIIFRDNRSYQSLGRRVFDVYIQAERKLKDFDIENEAQGVDKAVKRIFKAVVSDKILEIRFQYTGKGTVLVPVSGSYGPLVSAISIESDFKPPDNRKRKIIIAIGVSASGLCLILSLIGIAWWSGHLGGRRSGEQDKTSAIRGLLKSATSVSITGGYMAPEYALWGHLTYKADVYSFGVVALEIVAGKNSVKYRPGEDYVCLLDWAFVLQRKGSLMELMDPRLGSNFDKKEATRMIKVALLCANPSPALRPMMSAVVGMLQGHISVQELNMDPSIYGDDLMFQSLSDTYNAMRPDNASETEALAHSSDVTRNDSSSTSDAARNETEALARSSDLYKVDLHFP
ncbi:hypothetical protein RJ639_024475 [Escallonia herrerae]|uniref:non-specific serine/threonine protein kinase n=1 Tax=Escallonia herrerae TaxID=1293975 RepID=A0AA89AEZ7_9ASTE|nr:hypothetical protein RJ639_024475 [Escallonia herrerae]